MLKSYQLTILRTTQPRLGPMSRHLSNLSLGTNPHLHCPYVRSHVDLSCRIKDPISMFYIQFLIKSVNMGFMSKEICNKLTMKTVVQQERCMGEGLEGMNTGVGSYILIPY